MFDGRQVWGHKMASCSFRLVLGAMSSEDGGAKPSPICGATSSGGGFGLGE